jgi:hypothetical protein
MTPFLHPVIRIAGRHGAKRGAQAARFARQRRGVRALAHAVAALAATVAPG